MALLLILPFFAQAGSEEKSIDQLLLEVPNDVAEREVKLKKLKHLADRLEQEKKIKENQAAIQKAKQEANTAAHVDVTVISDNPIEKQMMAALGQNNEGQDASPRNNPVKHVSTQVSEFDGSISLISIYGNPKSPTADIVLDGRQTEVTNGSLIKGWEVVAINAEYLQLKRKGKVNRIFYSNAASD